MSIPAVITVVYKELGKDRGLGGGWDDKGKFNTRPYLIDYGLKDKFMAQLAGGNVYSGPPGKGTWVQTMPFVDPDDANLFVTGLTWAPEGQQLVTASGLAAYEAAVVTATFRRLTYDFSFDNQDNPLMSIDNQTVLPNCTQKVKLSTQYLDIPPGTLQWASDSKPANVADSRRTILADIYLQFHKLPLMPFPKLKLFIDNINSNTILGCSPESLMYTGCETEIGGPDANGNQTQEVAIFLKWRSQSWNKSFRPSTLAWDYLQTSTGSRKYGTTDYSGLLLSLGL